MVVGIGTYTTVCRNSLDSRIVGVFRKRTYDLYLFFCGYIHIHVINIANVLGVSTDLLLADVLNAKYEIKSSEITDEISSLKPTERDRIYNVIGAMIDFEKKK